MLVQDDEPAVWAVAQDYVGPDGIARRREGLVASLRVEPYATGPCCRTSARTPGRRRAGCASSAPRGRSSSRSSCSTTASLPWPFPDREPDLVAGGDAALARSGDGVAEAFADRQLLIADGHHRYETALAYAEEQGTPESARMMVVLVSTVRPRPRDLPHPSPLPRPRGRAAAGGRRRLRTARRRGRRASRRLPYTEAHAVGYRRGSTFPVVGEPGELDVELVDRLVGHEGLGYTADLDEAIARVDSGEFDGAFLLRATRIEDVFERARRGEVMPQKTTYFFPKLTSGLLFHPV